MSLRERLGRRNRGDSSEVATVFPTVLVISKKEVTSGDIVAAKEAIQRSLDQFETTRALVPILLTINDYADDPRGLFEVPEVRDWCLALMNACPFVFSVLDASTIEWFFPSVVGIQVLDQNTGKGTTQVKYETGAKKRVDQIFILGGGLLQSLAKSQAEFDRLAVETGSRIRQGLRHGKLK